MINVSIRPLREQDAYTSVRWRNDPEVFKYTGNTYKNEISLETELSWIRRVMENADEYRCAILADDVYVGNIYLTGIDGTRAEYHIFIGDKAYWGKGVAKKASKLILQYAFETLNLSQVDLRVKRQNESAYNLYKRLGFAEELCDGDWIAMSIKRI